jgi:hypothetical protein
MNPAWGQRSRVGFGMDPGGQVGWVLASWGWAAPHPSPLAQAIEAARIRTGCPCNSASPHSCSPKPAAGRHPPANGPLGGGTRPGAISTASYGTVLLNRWFQLKDHYPETLSSPSSHLPAGGLSSPGPRPCSVVTTRPSHWGPPPSLKHSSCC